MEWMKRNEKKERLQQKRESKKSEGDMTLASK